MAYILVMEFEWDDAKSNDCFMHRGFDFAYAIRAFLDPNRIVGRDRRWDYGEDRYQLLGAIERRVFVLISTLRDVPMFEELMKDGSQWGLDLSYRVQP